MSSVGLFDKVTSLSKKPKKDEALMLLNKLAAQVEPIMKKRGWQVRLLKEIFPNNPNLLGLNYGRTVYIAIRLRHPYDEASFLPFHSLLGTMLHELCHIVHSPHDKNFYELLGVLTDECESLLIKGIHGFFGKGNRLGEMPKNPLGIRLPSIPSTPGKFSAFSGKGHKLGSKPSKLPDMIKHFTDQKKNMVNAPDSHPAWCASNKPESPASSSVLKRPSSDIIVISDDEDLSVSTESTKSWTCLSCTCINPPLILQCMVCYSKCPPQAVASGLSDSFWSCTQCTLINQASDHKCIVCFGPKS